MYKSRIFGTPPEPVFNMKSACLPPELLEEALYVLAAENEKSMNDANGMQGFFKGGKTAGNLTYKTAFVVVYCKWEKQVYYILVSCFSEYVFLLCEEMGLPTQTRYLAIEIFDRQVKTCYKVNLNS